MPDDRHAGPVASEASGGGPGLSTVSRTDAAFETPGLRQRLERFYYLILYRRTILVLGGPEGAGKTRFLERLGRRVEGNCRVLEVAARQGMLAGDLLGEINRGLGLVGEGERLEGLEAELQAYLERPDPRPRIVLAMIDDVQCLHPDALAALLRFVRRCETAPCRLRVVMTATAEAASSLGRTASTGVPVHVEQLTPFSPAHVAEYVHRRARAAGWRTKRLFDAEVMDRIVEESEGWPGRIDALIRPRLEQAAARRGLIRGRSARALGGLGLGAVLVLMWMGWVFRR